MSSSSLLSKEVYRLLTKPSIAISAALNDAPTIFQLGRDDSTCTVDAKTTALLLAQSKFFENMFKWGFKEAQLQEGNQRVIRLDNITLPVFHILLAFARTLKLPSSSLDEESIWELRSYAHYLDWDLLEFACEQSLAARLEPSTVCLVWNLAERNQAVGLSEMCQKFFTKNFADTASTASFFMLRKELLARALRTGDIECDNEVIIRALFIWARFQHHSVPENRSTQYDPLRYVGDLLPPSTLFNTQTKAAVLGYGSPLSRLL
eukprot:TRINITY_DN14165_c0_g1_i1.p1 TRINITY_DN14165_c0_g1~~TRINITY_DN14165_c0_g1_i1.p1  ORF type:complete len:263 (+),score=42.48 TRINITY_DN14165_c0_g1_i1:82-870(+)